MSKLRTWIRYAVVIKESGQLSRDIAQERKTLQEEWMSIDDKLHHSVQIIKVKVTEIPRKKKA